MQRRFWGAITALGLTMAVVLSANSGGVVAAGKKKAMAKKPAAGAGAAMGAQGKQFVAADGCTGCHKIGGKGGTTGPDLSHVGSKLTAAEIAAKIKNPKAKNPNSIMPASKRPDKQIAAMAAYLASLK
jgi:mono/diheme cytochrome c family protein